jgi:glycosyltransferase involved in cell wall biosynthesis
VHQVTVKPVLYGSLAARAMGVPAVVNAISGLGYVFTGDERGRGLRRVVHGVYAAALRNPRSRTIFQNPDDRRLFVSNRLVRGEQTVLIRGSGVDCSLFAPTPEPAGTPVVMLPARMLWDKGVGPFVEAARILRTRGARARFVLVGASDAGNPTAVPEAQLRAWAAEGVVEWWGPRDAMHHTLAEASIAVLPSRREGLPKVLLESAACARPMVATDVPGCREVVRPGENGLLVPVDDGPALAEAIGALLDSPELRARYGAAARAMAVAEFAEEVVVGRTMELYRELLGSRWPTTAP